jgi:protease PrsW
MGHPEAIVGPGSWRHAAVTAGTAVLTVAVLWLALTTLGGA